MNTSLLETMKEHKCDALQPNGEQVAQAYFEIRTIEVGKRVKNNSSVNFETFTYLNMFSIYHLHVISD